LSQNKKKKKKKKKKDCRHIFLDSNYLITSAKEAGGVSTMSRIEEKHHPERVEVGRDV
jgi:hypothetical protein